MPMKGGTTSSFVTDGLESALEQARAAAGERDVGVWGDGEVRVSVLEGGACRRDA